MELKEEFTKGLAGFMASLNEEQLAYFVGYADTDTTAAIAAAIRAVKPLYAPPDKPRRGRPRKATNGSGA